MNPVAFQALVAGQSLVQLGLPDVDIAWDEHIVLVGEGAYDGLSAVFKREFAEGQWTFEGYILDGSVPPFPDPYEADAFPQE